MTKSNMTIDEVKKAKIKLEKDVLELLKTFESETGVYTSYMNFRRKEDKDTLNGVQSVEDNVKRGPLVDISINMDLDLVY